MYDLLSSSIPTIYYLKISNSIVLQQLFVDNLGYNVDN